MKSGGKAWTKEGRPKVTYYLVIFLHLYFNSDLSGIFGPYFWVGKGDAKLSSHYLYFYLRNAGVAKLCHYIHHLICLQNIQKHFY